jgi:hypothetical protein
MNNACKSTQHEWCALVIATGVFVRGFKRWVRGDEIKQVEEEEDRSAVRRALDDA